MSLPCLEEGTALKTTGQKDNMLVTTQDDIQRKCSRNRHSKELMIQAMCYISIISKIQKKQYMNSKWTAVLSVQKACKQYCTSVNLHKDESGA